MFGVETCRIQWKTLRVCASCDACCQLKPRFFHGIESHTIKASRPFERLSMDFMGPKVSATRNKYILTIVDEYSRFPFMFPCPDMTAATVIRCLRSLFSMFGLPNAIHSDRGTNFMSQELKDYLTAHSIAQTRTTPYRPECNGQCERYNGVLWKSILLKLKSENKPI